MLLMFAAALWALACRTDDDCHLNGVCTTQSTCSCAPGWTGSTCAQLHLLPAKPRPFAGYEEADTASWGGSVLEDPSTGLFHMYVSRMAGHCGLRSWTSNSEVVHATSLDPEGPYVFAEVVVPHFAHGPKVRRLADGRFLMMYLGCGEPFQPYVHGCANGTTPPHAAGGAGDPNGRHAAVCSQFNVSVRTAASPEGPWSAPRQVFLSGGGQQSWFVNSSTIFTNPSPFPLKNGSLICSYRANAMGAEHVSVATAAGVDGPYLDTRALPALENGNGSWGTEDPFLWRDERQHWHMLMHNLGAAGVSSHAYSRDGQTWTRATEEPYTKLVEFADGSRREMNSRERPELMLSAEGTPRYFVSGVTVDDDYTYTLVVKLGAGGGSRGRGE